MFDKQISSVNYSSPLYSQDSTQDNFSISLSSGKYFDNDSFELTWIDDNRLLFREERQLKLIINISDKKPEVITITDFLMKDNDGLLIDFIAPNNNGTVIRNHINNGCSVYCIDGNTVIGSP